MSQNLPPSSPGRPDEPAFDGTSAPPAPSPPPASQDAPDPLRHSRTSGAWAGVIAAAVLLVLLVIFIVQNTESTRIEFLGFDGSVPLAAALLLAAVVGMAVVGAVGSLRILQLRRRVKRERR